MWYLASKSKYIVDNALYTKDGSKPSVVRPHLVAWNFTGS